MLYVLLSAFEISLETKKTHKNPPLFIGIICIYILYTHFCSKGNLSRSSSTSLLSSAGGVLGLTALYMTRMIIDQRHYPLLYAIIRTAFFRRLLRCA